MYPDQSNRGSVSMSAGLWGFECGIGGTCTLIGSEENMRGILRESDRGRYGVRWSKGQRGSPAHSFVREGRERLSSAVM